MGVSPFDKPEMETVAVPIPSLTWPLIWLALTGYSVLSGAVGIIGDPGNSAFVLAVSLGFYWLALRFYRVRIAEREQWRQERFDEWMHKVLPPPPVTDWDKFEYDVAKMVAEQERPRAQKDFGGVKRTKPGTSHHGVDQGVHQRRLTKGGRMYWDKRDWR